MSAADDLEERVNSTYQEWLRLCATDGHGGYDSQSECEGAALAWRIAQVEKINDGEENALNQNWTTARNIREQVEKENSRRNRKIKIGIDEDGISVEGESTSNSNESPQGLQIGISPVGDPVRLVDKSWSFSGTLDWSYMGQDIVVNIAGSLFGVVGESGARGMKGRFTGGELQMQLPNGDVVPLTLDPTESSLIQTDSVTGIGFIDFVADADYPNDAMAWVLQSSTWFRLPITSDETGSFIISTGVVHPDELYPHIDEPYTDFNLDNVLHYETDYAAFLSAWGQNDPRADINVDDQWDQQDVNMWIDAFFVDYDYHQGQI
tara:strand:- start:834 stop:1796 length:963 start_codon:yes stop_codon:yes gene_type:complete